MEEIEMLHGAIRLARINAGLKPEERALIVCDTDNLALAKVLAYAVKSIGAEYSICIMEPRTTHGENPTDAIAAAMQEADVIFAPTRFSLSHSEARIRANENGARFISMPDYSRDMMKKGGALDADFLGIYETVKSLQKILTDAGEIKITTDAGTNMTVQAAGRFGNEVSGVCREPGTWGSPPNIEVNVSPIEDESSGVVVVDGSIPMPEIGVLREPVILKIKKGKIIGYSGGAAAETFRALLKTEENPANDTLAEFGIGLNDRAVLKGSMLEDEGAYGTCHFGFGFNKDQGGESDASVHIDCVFREPDVVVDGKKIIQKGVLIL